VPFDRLLCVGFGKGTKERKLQAIKDERIAMFIDDNKRYRDFLGNNAVNVVGKVNQFG